MPNDETPEISLYHRSPGLDPSSVEYAVTVPTFRRPEHLRRTLDSIAGQRPASRFAAIVMENDAERLEGALAAKTYLSNSPLPGLVIVAHQRGNCHVYNAGWRTALEQFPAMKAVAVIDDDELADPNWLENLIKARELYDVDIVGAPQIPVFSAKTQQKWAQHPVFAPAYGQSGPVPILYSSGNVLITRAVLQSMPQPFLDPMFNFVGGGDSDFYHRARERGMRFAWCVEAPVYETIPDRRTDPSWMRARSRREGALSAMIEKRLRPGVLGRLRTLGKSIAMLGLAPLRSLRLWLHTGSPEIGVYCLNAAIGRFVAEFGAVNEQYRNPD